MIKKRLNLVLLIVLFSSGCTHCSITRTAFDGKTSGLNPYGSGTLDVVRESVWGSKGCLEAIKCEEMDVEAFADAN